MKLREAHSKSESSPGYTAGLPLKPEPPTCIYVEVHPGRQAGHSSLIPSQAWLLCNFQSPCVPGCPCLFLWSHILDICTILKIDSSFKCDYQINKASRFCLTQAFLRVPRALVPRCCFDDVVHTENHLCCFSCTQKNLSLHLEALCYTQYCHVSDGTFLHIWKKYYSNCLTNKVLNRL